MRRQRAVLGLARREQPGLAVRLHDERLAPRRSRPCPWHLRRADSRAACRAGNRARRRRPSFCCVGIPPDIFLPLRPGPALRIGGGAVVHDAAIVRPGEAPVRLHRVVGDFAVAGAIAARLGKDAAVDPAAARRRSVVLQVGKAAQQLRAARVPDPVAVRSWPLISCNTLATSGSPSMRLIDHPAAAAARRNRSPRSDARAARHVDPSNPAYSCFQALAEVVDEPGIGPAIAGRIDGLVVPLQEPLRVGEAAFFFRGGGGGNEEDFGFDLGRGRAGRIVLPERRRFPSRTSPAPPAIAACAGRRGAAPALGPPPAGFWPNRK